MQTTTKAGALGAGVQARASRRAWITLGLAGGMASVATLLALGERPDAPQPAPASAGRFPDVPLLTHEGKAVRFHSDLVAGRIVFINMMYAQCTNRCPPMTQNLKRVHALLGERAGQDVFMYSLTLRPEFDRPQDLRAYMRVNEVEGPGWTFLTGQKAHVESVRRSLGFYSREPEVDGDVTQHTGMVCIGNDALGRWCTTPAMLSPERIVDTLMAIDPVARAKGRGWT